LLCDQARRHAVDAALSDAAAKIPGSAVFGEIGFCRSRSQRLVDGRDGEAVTLGQRRRESARAARNGGSAVAFGDADDELRGAPILEDAIELAPGRLTLGTHRRERRCRPRLEVRGGDAYTPEPEVERYEEVAIGVASTKTRHVAIRRRQA
jgi:hypothetical protein